MRVVSKSEFEDKREEYEHRMKSQVFIYPTDTIYGIGCNAMINGAVERIRKLKSRYARPFSIIAPSVEWIRENCEVDDSVEQWLEKLPGPYTLVLKLKSQNMISSLVNQGADGTIGVRIPDHWMSDVVAEIGYPIITTSANHVGENYMTSLDDLAPDIEHGVDFIIYEGDKQGSPSRMVNLLGDKPSVEVR